jgi:hypothetical protein
MGVEAWPGAADEEAKARLQPFVAERSRRNTTD